MFKETALSGQTTFFQKLRSIDYILLICILILGIVSSLAMYATDGGELLYHTKSHVLRFIIFFIMMFVLSFLNIRFWHATGYLFYIIVLGLLIWASLYGITASGSQRWVDLYFINLQPSELMKIAIIVCFARFFHREQITNVSSLKNIIVSIHWIICSVFSIKVPVTEQVARSSIIIIIN